MDFLMSYFECIIFQKMLLGLRMSNDEDCLNTWWWQKWQDQLVWKNWVTWSKNQFIAQIDLSVYGGFYFFSFYPASILLLFQQWEIRQDLSSTFKYNKYLNKFVLNILFQKICIFYL